MGDDPGRLYRLDGVAHIAGVINDEPRRCISTMRRQQGMQLDERWFRLDEPLVSAFIERWRPETHTFHMPFGECTITLQDVAYQLGLPVDGHYVSGCLTNFHVYIQGGWPAWQWFQELLGVLPPPSQIQKFAVNCSWFQETFGECPEGADKATVRHFARAYIMMLLGTQLFADKSGNRIHIRWLPYVARLEEMGGYSWGSAALAWLYQCMCRVANRHVVKLAGPLQLLQSWIFWWFPRFWPDGYDTFSWPLASKWSGYNPGVSEKGPRFIWMPYSTPDVLQVIHSEVLEPRHTTLWRSVTSLIYFAVVEWHQVDRVLPQFGGVQACPRPVLNINFLMSKDGRRGDRWFPHHLQHWHLHWETRADHVLRLVASAWKEVLVTRDVHGDPRDISIPVEATQRGVGRVPDMDRVDDVPDRRRIDRRVRVGTRRSDREWRWLDQAIEDDDQAGRGRGRRRGRGGRRKGPADHHVGGDPRDDAAPGGVAQGVVIPDAGGAGGQLYGSGMGDPSAPVDAGIGEGPFGDYFVGVPSHD
nr:serine/threonine-protein phosphatase 7 long form homolog [Arachis hypogaea]